MCIVVGCGSKSDTTKGIGMFRIPSIIKNQGEEIEELTTLRREKWISAISRGDTAYKDILQSERVCGRHFVSGRPAQHWDKHNVDWKAAHGLFLSIFPRMQRVLRTKMLIPRQLKMYR